MNSWEAALRIFADLVPSSGAILVLDEMPYLVQRDSTFEGTLQKVFDRVFSRIPILLIGIGSDMAQMASLNEYGRPFYQRAAEMVVPPLSPKELGELLHIPPALAFDAHLVTGGLPLLAQQWPKSGALWEFLEEGLQDSTSALIVSAERTLTAEFPNAAQARSVLEAIGTGERTFANIGREASDLTASSLSRALGLLRHRELICVDQPLSAKFRAQDKRYRIADPYLRFWLTFIGRRLPMIERGRGDQVLDLVRRGWTSWRGRAIEPIVRESIARLNWYALDYPGSEVGSYWTRTNNPEVDLVIADQGPPKAQRVLAVGSIKWLESAGFDDHDARRLRTHREQIPGATEKTELIAVSRAKSAAAGLRILYPEDLYSAW
ncbi:MAG: ATP-binding protein [Angustibacter sp.]